MGEGVVEGVGVGDREGEVEGEAPTLRLGEWEGVGVGVELAAQAYRRIRPFPLSATKYSPGTPLGATPRGFPSQDPRAGPSWVPVAPVPARVVTSPEGKATARILWLLLSPTSSWEEVGSQDRW